MAQVGIAEADGMAKVKFIGKHMQILLMEKIKYWNIRTAGTWRAQNKRRGTYGRIYSQQ